MSGYTKIYVIGGKGGFQGVDGVNPIELMILVGDGNRRWLSPQYFNQSLKSLGRLNTLIPSTPSDSNALLDACIAFHPLHFRACDSLKQVENLLQESECLDFTSMPQEIRQTWETLRNEARPLFEKLNIYQAVLTPVHEN